MLTKVKAELLFDCLGSQAFSIVREFLQFFNLDFTLAVLDPEANYVSTCGALRDLVALVQFKKREKHPWRSVNSSKVAG